MEAMGQKSKVEAIILPRQRRKVLGTCTATTHSTSPNRTYPPLFSFSSYSTLKKFIHSKKI